MWAEKKVTGYFSLEHAAATALDKPRMVDVPPKVNHDSRELPLYFLKLCF
jgi:hypothetical protein